MEVVLKLHSVRHVEHGIGLLHLHLHGKGGGVLQRETPITARH